MMLHISINTVLLLALKHQDIKQILFRLKCHVMRRKTNMFLIKTILRPDLKVSARIYIKFI